MLPNTRQLLGADMDSVPFLRDALNQSAQLQSSVASIPFKLVEGSQGYVLFRPIFNRPRGKQAFAQLVINADAILKEIAPLLGTLKFSLYHVVNQH